MRGNGRGPGHMVQAVDNTIIIKITIPALMSTLLSRAEGVLSWSAWSWSACLKQGGSNLQHALDALGPFSIVKKTISFASYELLFAKLAPR